MKVKILALGDSWFHYPYGLDRDGNILGPLYWIKRKLGLVKDMGNGNLIKYLVSVNKLPLDYRETTVSQFAAMKFPIDHSLDDVLGQCGEELMVMVYGHSRSKPNEIMKGKTWLEVLEQRVKKEASNYDRFVILLSAGGNDIVDKNLRDFLKDANTYNPPVDQDAFNTAIGQLKAAYQEIFNRISVAAGEKEVHFILHGYAYPPVNGRGVFINLEKSPIKVLHKLSPGPWLQPYFIQNNINNRPQQEEIIGGFMDQFNAMLQSLHPAQATVFLHYVDLRGITDKINRDPGWCNELHFDHDSFLTAASKMFEEIDPLV